MLNFLGFADVVTTSTPGALDEPTVVSIETFDHFYYTLKVTTPQKGQGNYQLAIGVEAEIPNERVAASDEKPEDKQNLDEEFQANTKRLRDKLAHESQFASNGWNYLIESRLIEPLLCKRADLLETTAIAEAKAK
jgi:hypothetical protein